MNGNFYKIAFLVITLIPVISHAAPVTPVSGSQPFAILACRYAGDLNEPVSTDELESMFGIETAAPGTVGTIDHYWREVSFGAIDMAGSQVFGWVELPGSRNYYTAYEYALPYLRQDCLAAVMTAVVGFDPSAYVGFAVILNDYFPPLPGGTQPAYGLYGYQNFALPNGVEGDWRVLWVSLPVIQKRSMYTHELGHTFDLFHSKRPSGIDYGSPWDVMSNGSCPVGDNSCVDVHPIAYQKASLGWIPANRRLTIDSYGTYVVSLASQTDPITGTGPLMVEVPTGVTDQIFTFEARVAEPGTYDSLLPFSGVIVHRVDDAYQRYPTIILQGEMQAPPNQNLLDVPTSVYEIGETFTASMGDLGRLTMTVNSALGSSANPPEGYEITVTLEPPPPFTGCSPGQQDQISEEECNALVELANMADTRPDDWLGVYTPCSWYGVVCMNIDSDPLLEVTSLNLSHPLFWDVTMSEEDDVFLGLPNLRHLRMDNSNYGVDGELPSSVFSLSQLESLYMNGFTNTLSPDIGNLSQLELLVLDHARFYGRLPAEIGDLSNLTTISLYHLRHIGGAIPKNWVNLTNLNDLRAWLSDLCIPSDPDFWDWFTGIATLQPNENSWPVCTPSDVAVVLDDTASMQNPTGDGSGNSKIVSLQNAIELFTSLYGYFRQDIEDRAAAITFKMPPGSGSYVGCDAAFTQELVALDSLDSSLPAISTAVGNMQADGWATPLRAGIEAASTLLSTSDAGRTRLMLLLTDGKQNTADCYIGPPYSEESVDSFKQTQLIDRDIKLLAVGFGSDGQIDDALLSALATDGYYDSADSTLELSKWFTQALRLALNQQMLLDPEGTLSAGASATHPVLLTSESESVAFVTTWTRDTADLKLTLTMPDGTELNRDDQTSGVTFLSGKTWQSIILDTPLRGDLAGKSLAGSWQATVSRSAEGESDEPYQVLVMGETPLQMETEINEETATTEDDVEVAVALDGASSATVVADIFVPVAGIGTVLAEPALTPADVMEQTAELGKDMDMLSRRVHLLKKNKFDWPIERRIHTINLVEDKIRRADADDRKLFRGSFRANTAEGVYTVRFRAVGESARGEKFQREFRRSIYVHLAVSADATKVDVQRIGDAQKSGGHSKRYRVSFAPQDANGLLLGPGYVDHIQILPSQRFSEVEDLGDGSYAVTFATEDDPDKQTVTISVLGQALRPVYLPDAARIEIAPWIIAGIMALLVLYLAYANRQLRDIRSVWP